MPNLADLATKECGDPGYLKFGAMG